MAWMTQILGQIQHKRWDWKLDSGKFQTSSPLLLKVLQLQIIPQPSKMSLRKMVLTVPVYLIEKVTTLHASL